MLNRVRRIVDRGLMGILPHTYVSPLTPPQLDYYKKLAHFDKQTFGTYTFPNGSTTPLYTKYRDVVKRTWRLMFPQLSYLYNLAVYHPLPKETQQLLDEIRQLPTLPVDENTLQQHADAVAAHYPQVSRTITDASGNTYWQYLNPDQVTPIIKSYRGMAGILETLLRRADGKTLKNLHTLEIGTGTGLNCYAVAERGAASSKGIDIEYAQESFVFRQEVIQEFVRRQSDIASRVELLNMNANQTTFEDASFDLIHSTSVLEHVQELHQTFKEMYRLLKPGAWAIHSIGPYFGPAGGHALVSLDFPWGHARLSDEQIHDYLRQHRPHEAEKASNFLTYGLTQPHHVLADYALYALQAGFEMVEWRENMLDNHRALITGEVFDQVKSHYPHVTLNDLLTNELVMVLHKPHVA